jgi:hypothetical protein
MTPTRSAPTGLGVRRTGRIARHLRVTTRAVPDAAVAGRRDLVLVAATIVGMAVVLTGPLVWVAAILVLGAVLIGTLQVLGEVPHDAATAADGGVPLESLFLPAIAAMGCLGAIRLVPLGLAVVPAVVAAGLLIDRALAIEARLARATSGPDDDDRSRALVAILVVALVAFTGVAAIVPGGIAGREPAGAPILVLPIGDLVLLALADAAVAGLLGYRAAALRSPSVGQATWAALSYATAIAVGAAALRAMGIPRLIGPALLMFLFYLWDTLHAAAPTRRRDPRWIWETVALAAVGAVLAFWNLRLVG